MAKFLPVLNLLFLIYDLERGGPELRLLDFLKHFPEEVTVHIFVTSRSLSLLPEFQQHTDKIEIMPIRKGYLAFFQAWRIRRYVKAHGIQIINSFDFKSLYAITLVKAFSGRTLRTVYHSVELDRPNSVLKKYVLRMLLGKTSAIVCNSEAAKNNMDELYALPRKVTVIRNGIDVGVFRKENVQRRKLRKRLGYHERNIVLGTIANFREEKNYPFLLDAFNILSKRLERLRLLCVGGGSLLANMKKRCRECGLADKVFFTDYSDEVVPYLAAMDVFVLCSLTESFPNALIQAMSMELPAIVSNVGGCNEIVAHMENGILYSSNDKKEFVDAIDLLIQNPCLANKLGYRARKTVIDLFSLENMISEYLSFFKSIQSA
jgi:glycosyltransferase involved in cell wall biosynthesis